MYYLISYITTYGITVMTMATHVDAAAGSSFKFAAFVVLSVILGDLIPEILITHDGNALVGIRERSV